MAPVSALADWFNVRPQELRQLGLGVACAFLALTFAVLSRSLREAFFLTVFDIRRLPWMIFAVVGVGLPVVGQFSRMLTIAEPRRVVRSVAIVLAAGILPLAAFLPGSRIAVVIFYILTAVGTLLVTSGFWVVVSEQFPLRGAKRLFGLISAGGTAGVMGTGISLSWLTNQIDLAWLVVGTTAVLAMFAAVLSLLPGARPPSPAKGDRETADRRREAYPQPGPSARLVWSTDHLRVIAMVIFCATVITTLVDFQFKNLARSQFAETVDLVSYFGAFYGWAGLAALVLQIVFVGRLLERTRIGVVMSISPFLMILGGGVLLAGAGLALATVVRGVDFTFRKALYRPAIEFLFVPVPPLLRRRTKTFIDSMIDASAEGFGALIILLWVSAGGLPASGLSVFSILAAGLLLYLGWRVDRQYFKTVVSLLDEEDRRTREALDTVYLPARDLLNATFTNLDLGSLRSEDRALGAACPPGPTSGEPANPEEQLLQDLHSPDDAVVLRALNRVDAFNPAHVQVMERLIARDTLLKRVLGLLERFHEDSVPWAVAALGNEETEFVIRRRIPDLLARTGGTEADEALIEALTDKRFEVRYRAALALVVRRKRGLSEARPKWRAPIWRAVRMEVSRDRTLWELQNLLDKHPADVDDLVTRRVGMRGELSLEHTFRLLTLVLEPEPVRAAYHGVVLDDDHLKSLALEYLEQALPRSIRHRLWLFIGDDSERRKAIQLRPIDAVVEELMATSMTIFKGDGSRLALRKMIEDGGERGSSEEKDVD
jgi:AAA family ATP:ADP antiporter